MEGGAMLTKAFFVLAVGLVVVMTGPAARAQQPTEAQKSAIRANCRSDFMANCSGVQPGGRDALQCLQRNLGKLSGGCQAAVSAISPPAVAPAAPVASAPAAPAMGKPPALKPATKTETRAPTAVPSPAAAPVAAAPAVSMVPPLVLRPMLPARRAIITGICRSDAERLCPGLLPIGPATLDCLAVKAGSLSPTCYEALARVSRP
jgi:hypothetical protein